MSVTKVLFFLSFLMSASVLQAQDRSKCEGKYSDEQKWFVVDGSAIVTEACPNGGQKQSQYEQQVEMICKVVGRKAIQRAIAKPTGKKKKGKLIKVVQACSSKPSWPAPRPTPRFKDCGSKKHGQTWSEVKDVTNTLQCPAGQQGSLTVFLKNTTNYKCINGESKVISRDVDEARTEGECRPAGTGRDGGDRGGRGDRDGRGGGRDSGPKKCGDKAHGAKWFQNDGETSKNSSCASGQVGSITKYFKVEAEYQCRNGESSKTGETKETYLRQKSTCKDKPKKSCGPRRAHGSTWESTSEYEETQSCERNPQQSIKKVFEKTVKYKCDDGDQKELSSSVKELRTVGECRAGRGDRDGGRGDRDGGRGDRDGRRGDRDSRHDDGKCEGHANYSSWYAPIGTDKKSLACDRGYEGEVVQTFEVEAEFTCRNGEIQRTRARSRAGRVLDSRSYCTKLPSNCGSIAHNSNGYITKEKDELLSCPAGYEGEVVKTYEVGIEVYCFNGEISETGNVVRRGVVDSRSSCREIPKLSCGRYEHGETWTSAVGEEDDEISCANGQIGRVALVYQTEQDFECVDGVQEVISEIRRGNLLSQNDTCRDKPKKGCGSKNHGEVWDEISGVIEETAQCKETDKSVTDLFESLESFKCVDGDKVPLNETSKGKYIKTIGTCEYSDDEVENQNREREKELVKIAKEEAQKICQEFAEQGGDEMSKSCSSLVKASRGITLEGVNACKNMSVISKLYCLHEVSNKRVYESEADFCSSLGGFWIFPDLYKTACLNEIQRPFEESAMTSNPEHDQKVEACRSEKSDAAKLVCFKKLFE